MPRLLQAFLAALLLFSSAGAIPNPLTTVAERSEFKRTGRYDEVEKLCKAFESQWPGSVKTEVFGTTPEGRPMLSLVVSSTGNLSPESAASAKKPVVVVQGGIHAGEVDGKDAGFLSLRNMLQQDAPALKELTVVFIPVFNVDGHERFGPWNRPNQVGPEEMGWRVTSNNLNLNRDYAKVDTTEMSAMLKLLNRWDPILYIDLHSTDGAQFQPDVAVIVGPTFDGDKKLQEVAKSVQDETLQALRQTGSMPLSFYPSFRNYKDPATGFEDGPYPPRFSTGYWSLRNRLTVLVETHSWKDYATRVEVSRNTVDSLLRIAARDGQRWMQFASEADRRSSALKGTKVALGFKTTGKSTLIDFPGYAYSVEPSEVSGTNALVYDPSTPENWRIPFFAEVEPSLVVTAPQGGYLIPPGQASWLSKKLKAHGIVFQTIGVDIPFQQLELYRAAQVKFSPRPFEGHQTAEISGQWKQETHLVKAGSLYVPVGQPKSRLVMALLEPEAPDSFAFWGFFNAHFEQKEYMEDYVAEQVARDMLKNRPEVAQEFHRRLQDPTFAEDSNARLEFFYRQHPSWDTRLNLYPVTRTDESYESLTAP